LFINVLDKWSRHRKIAFVHEPCLNAKALETVGDMRVNVFISDQSGDEPLRLLVLSVGPEAVIPRHLQHLEWRHFATTMTDDKLLGASSSDIEKAIAKQGFALVSPTG